jgi:hypothetical protein
MEKAALITGMEISMKGLSKGDYGTGSVYLCSGKALSMKESGGTLSSKGQGSYIAMESSSSRDVLRTV